MIVKDLLLELDQWAPYRLQEDYDNSGLMVGDPKAEIKGVLVNLDLTPEVIEEAIALGANVIITHHPILFRAQKRILADDSIVNRCIISAIRHDIQLISFHTNLDNVRSGVNHKIAELLGIKNTKILAPKERRLLKLIVFVPSDQTENLLHALFESGAGTIGNYSECSFRTSGTGTFMPMDGSQPYSGTVGYRAEEAEEKLEVIFPDYLQAQVIRNLIKAHPYEVPAYDILALENDWEEVGSGMIGELEQETDFEDFMTSVKKVFDMPYLRHTEIIHTKVQRIAFCGGAGSFLLPRAIAANAHVYLSADFKYHDFFDTQKKINLIDMGHYEMEQYTSQLIISHISQKNRNFAIHLSKINTNPIQYF